MEEHYITEQYQLPEKAQSLHTPVDFTAFVQGVAEAIGILAAALAEAIPAFLEALEDALEDALRNNAYHPSIVQGTGYTLPDKQAQLAEHKEALQN